ncbi:hypothetical protein [Paraburkholderia silvatlantica]|uniref:hypothetical protein n=1 Tax=Paraburkholderia silvatlantica TaxID=321895 RepID=UPI0011B64D4F|nr:hypothetical protein [Paraburkholderia silvatlantica]
MKDYLMRTPYGAPVEDAVLPVWQTRGPVPDDSNPRAPACIELVWNFVKVNGSRSARIECFLSERRAAKFTGVKKARRPSPSRLVPSVSA